MVQSSYLISIYFVYAAISIGLTAVLARTLFRNGEIFLGDIFDTPEMAAAVNRLLVVGFYMLNLGYALLIFETNGAATMLEATEVMVTKIGLLLVSLGVIHFLNLLVFTKIRNRARGNNTLPVAPAGFAPVPPLPAAQPLAGTHG